MKDINTLHIAGRRWFRRSYGQTYHAATVYVNDTQLEVPKQYGYGDSFLDSAFRELEKAGYDLKGASPSTLQWREKLNGTYSVADVSRERDL